MKKFLKGIACTSLVLTAIVSYAPKASADVEEYAGKRDLIELTCYDANGKPTKAVANTCQAGSHDCKEHYCP